MTSSETNEREPTEDDLAEYADDPYVKELVSIGDRLIVLSNSIDFELPPEADEVVAEESAEGGAVLSPAVRSEETRYLSSIGAALSSVEEAIRLRMRICYRQFPFEEDVKPADKKKKPKKKQ